LRQDKSALELAGGYAAVEVGPGSVIHLTTPYIELVLLDGNFKLVARKPGDRQRDAEFLRRILRPGHAFYIIRGIALIGRLGRPIDDPLEIVEAKQIRAGK